MTVTNGFFVWFLYGGGVGGWVLFLLAAVAANVWMIYDIQKRMLKATGWLMAAILSGLLIVPVILYRFTVNPVLPDPTSPLVSYGEAIFYLGILAGIAPVVIAVGYYVTFQGLVGCMRGHVYDVGLRQCPECARIDNPPRPVAPPAYPPQMPAQPRPQEDFQAAPRKNKPKTQAWLSNSAGKSYQLCAGETTVGRSPQNDIQISGDTTVGRQHAKIVEQNGHFKLIDLGTKNYTRVNGNIVRQPVNLEPNDEICFGDNSVMRFVA
ncbi:MAG: FHA domain-containing protein [Anaerolineales bacterium]